MEPEAAALSCTSNATKACKISSASSRRSPATPQITNMLVTTMRALRTRQPCPRTQHLQGHPHPVTCLIEPFEPLLHCMRKESKGESAPSLGFLSLFEGLQGVPDFLSCDGFEHDSSAHFCKLLVFRPKGPRKKKRR